MNSRERVLKAFKILPGKPDRVPVQPDVPGHLPKDLKDNFGHLFPKHLAKLIQIPNLR